MSPLCLQDATRVGRPTIMRLLLVDDDTLTRRVLLRKLRGFGHAVFGCRCVTQPDAAQPMDGWLFVARSGHEAEALGHLRARADRPPGAPATCLLIAPQVTPELRLAACEAGADGVLPLDADDLEWRALLAIMTRHAARESQRVIHDRELERSLAAAQRGLDAAADMQRSLLPPAGRSCPGVRTAWSFLPSASVAGDLLGVHALDETRTAFFLLDVSGHGVPAAMFSCSLSLLLHPPRVGDVPFHAGMLAASEDLLGSPAGLLMELNRRYLDDSEIPRHFSIAYGVLDVTRGTLRMAQAGLPAPFTQHGGILLERTLPGPPLGLLPGALYDEIEVGFVTGDRLFLHSDGLSECPGRDHQPYAVGRLRRVLEAQATTPIDQVVRAVEHSLRDWHGNDRFPDDVSFLALEAV